MHLFEIGFFEDSSDQTKWLNLFDSILNTTKKFELIIEFESDKISYYIKSEIDLLPLNSKLFPFILINKDANSGNLSPHSLIQHFKTKLKKQKINKPLMNIYSEQKTKGAEFLYLIVLFKRKKIVKRKSDKVRGKLYYTKNGHNMSKKISENYLVTDFFAIGENVNLGISLNKIKPFLDNSDGLAIATNKGSFLKVKNITGQDELLDITDYDFYRHSLIVGQSGVGKTQMMKLFIDSLYENNLTNEYCVVVIDPHMDFAQSLSNRRNSKFIDFANTGIKPFYTSSNDLIGTELSLSLFKNILEEKLNPKLERVLKHLLYVMYASKSISFLNLNKFLTDLVYRKSIINNTNLPQNIIDFFDNDFTQILVQDYEVAVLPILNLIEELFFVPAIADESKQFDLVDVLNSNDLVLFGLNKMTLGENVLKTISGLIILQTFLIAQERKLNKKLILIIDEFSLIQNSSISEILSEARKFDLSLFLSLQYLTQIKPDILQSVLTNIVNSYVFKVSPADAEIFERFIPIEFDQIFKTQLTDSYMDYDVLRKEIFTGLDPRELIVRVMKSNMYKKPFKSYTVDTK